MLPRMKREVGREVRRRAAFCYETWKVAQAITLCPNTRFGQSRKTCLHMMFTLCCPIYIFSVIDE